MKLPDNPRIFRIGKDGQLTALSEAEIREFMRLSFKNEEATTKVVAPA